MKPTRCTSVPTLVAQVSQETFADRDRLVRASLEVAYPTLEVQNS